MYILNHLTVARGNQTVTIKLEVNVVWLLVKIKNLETAQKTTLPCQHKIVFSRLCSSNSEFTKKPNLLSYKLIDNLENLRSQWLGELTILC